MGEGWGEGGPLPFIPSHQGRGNMTFYEVIIFNKRHDDFFVPLRLGG